MRGMRKLVLWYLAAALGVIVAQFEYHETDSYDQMEHMFRIVTPDNCYIKPLVSASFECWEGQDSMVCRKGRGLGGC